MGERRQYSEWTVNWYIANCVWPQYEKRWTFKCKPEKFRCIITGTQFNVLERNSYFLVSLKSFPFGANVDHFHLSLINIHILRASPGHPAVICITSNDAGPGHVLTFLLFHFISYFNSCSCTRTVMGCALAEHWIRIRIRIRRESNNFSDLSSQDTTIELENVGLTFSRFNPFPSWPSVAKTTLVSDNFNALVHCEF